MQHCADLSSIESRALRENDFVLINFPGQGVLPLRITAKDFTWYDYPEVGGSAVSGSIASDGFIDYARLPISAFSILNAFKVENRNRILQMFYGVRPGPVRVYLGYPLEQTRGNLETRKVSTRSPFGYVSGWQSPLLSPNRVTETWVPFNIDVGFAFWNPAADSAVIRFGVYLYRYEHEVLKDPELVRNLVNGQPARIITLGGVENLTYNVKDNYGISPVPLGATREQVRKALA